MQRSGSIRHRQGMLDPEVFLQLMFVLLNDRSSTPGVRPQDLRYCSDFPLVDNGVIFWELLPSNGLPPSKASFSTTSIRLNTSQEQFSLYLLQSSPCTYIRKFIETGLTAAEKRCPKETSVLLRQTMLNVSTPFDPMPNVNWLTSFS